MRKPVAFLSRPDLRWRDSLVACDFGGALIVKLLNFIEDQEAELLDVTEDQMRLRIGRTWWERWRHGLPGHAPLEVRLDIRHGTEEVLKPHHSPRSGHSQIDVDVRPLSRSWKPESFQSQAERVVHRLRRHLFVG